MSNKLVIALIAVLSVSDPSACDEVVVIASPMVTNWGEWGEWEYCPKAKFAQAAQLKVEPYQGDGDDTTLNAIRLYCGDPQDPETVNITSTEGPWGDWLPLSMTCPNQFNAFELKSEGTRNSGDRVATSNARFQCIVIEKSSPQKVRYEILEQTGYTHWGSWTGMQTCAPEYAICGIQTQVKPRHTGDATGLDNIRIACCELHPIPI